MYLSNLLGNGRGYLGIDKAHFGNNCFMGFIQTCVSSSVTWSYMSRAVSLTTSHIRQLQLDQMKSLTSC